MKILHICYEYPPIGGGGGEACRNIVEQTAAMGVKNTVITSRLRGRPKRETGRNYEVIRLRTLRRKSYQSNMAEMAIFLLASLAWSVRRPINKRFDLIHAHFAVPSGPAGWVLDRLFGAGYIMTLQGGDVPSFVPEQTGAVFRVLKPITKPIWRRAKAIFAVSHGLAELARGDYPGVEIGVIFNGVDNSFFGRPRRTIDHLKIVFAGRLSVQKHVKTLIAALAILKDRENWEADILGDGPLAGDLKKQVKQAGLAHRIKFHGWLPKREVIEHLSRANLFVLPSLKEGLPLAGVQAMANGLPLVGSDVVGVRDVIEDRVNGRLFPCGDDHALAGILNRLAREPELIVRMSRAALASAEQYRWENIAREYFKQYQRLCQDKVFTEGWR